MQENLFTSKTIKPDNQKLSKALGVSYKYWEEIRKSLTDEYGEIVEEWKYYGQKIGWTLKLLLKKRNLFFLTAYDKFFRISFVFGDKAVSAIEKSDIPQYLIEELRNAKKYVEGRGLRIEVRKKGDIDAIKKLVAFKINH